MGNHENVDIYKLAYDIIEQYFSEEVTEGEDPNLVPEATEDGYQFDANPGAPKEGFQFLTVKKRNSRKDAKAEKQEEEKEEEEEEEEIHYKKKSKKKKEKRTRTESKETRVKINQVEGKIQTFHGFFLANQNESFVVFPLQNNSYFWFYFPSH